MRGAKPVGRDWESGFFVSFSGAVCNWRCVAFKKWRGSPRVWALGEAFLVIFGVFLGHFSCFFLRHRREESISAILWGSGDRV